MEGHDGQTSMWPTSVPAAAPGVDEPARWADSALLVDEAWTAARLLEASGSQDDHLVRANVKFTLGDLSAATDELEAAQVGPPDRNSPVRWPHILLGGVRAGAGDAGALTWLRSLLPHLERAGWVEVMHVIALAADARGDVADGDAAWLALKDANRPVLGAHEAVRTVTAWIAGRGTDASVQDGVAQLIAACDLLNREQLRVTGRSLVAATAQELLRRGDVGGATLLVRAARKTQPRDVELEEMASALDLSARGLGRADRRLWRRFGRYEFLGATRTRHPDAFDWVVVGTVLLGAMFPSVLLGEDPGGHRVAHSPLFWVLADVGTAAAFGLLLWWGIRRSRSRPRQLPHVVARQQAEATVCRCEQVNGFVGPAAQRYATFHLGADGSVGGDLVDGGTVVHCPVTRRLWLVGPIGEGGRWLALGAGTGELPDSGDPEEPPTHPGFYL